MEISYFSDHELNKCAFSGFCSWAAPHQSLSGNGEVELMTGDWDKYYQECFATGGANGTIYGWDMRRMDMPTYQIQGINHL